LQIASTCVRACLPAEHAQLRRVGRAMKLRRDAGRRTGAHLAQVSPGDQRQQRPRLAVEQRDEELAGPLRLVE